VNAAQLIKFAGDASGDIPDFAKSVPIIKAWVASLKAGQMPVVTADDIAVVEKDVADGEKLYDDVAASAA
jgi:hypothetical protein